MKYRSVLFVPGHEEKKIKKAYSLDADLIVIDLESTVPNNEKENAKKIIRSCLKKIWCRLGDSNSRPDDYKSTALPAELSRHRSNK